MSEPILQSARVSQPEPLGSSEADCADAVAAMLALMARLRGAGGCDWDRAQSFATIAPYTIEEAYEVADAIATGDMAALQDELGDLLFQVLFHARMAEELGAFDFAAVARGLVSKMTARHPHVFGDAAARSAGAQAEAWEALKAEERRRRAERSGDAPSTLDGVPLALPALVRAGKLGKRAARVGFDWPDASAVLDKLEEEIAELRAAIEAGTPADRREELGDLLFATAQLGRKLDIEPEDALRAANAKFTRRFRSVEAIVGPALGTVPLAVLEAAWSEAKRRDPATEDAHADDGGARG